MNPVLLTIFETLGRYLAQETHASWTSWTFWTQILSSLFLERRLNEPSSNRVPHEIDDHVLGTSNLRYAPIV
jgi:hypothetical protein